MSEDKKQFKKHVAEIAESSREFLNIEALSYIEDINTDELVAVFEASLTLQNLLKVAKQNAAKVAKV